MHMYTYTLAHTHTHTYTHTYTRIYTHTYVRIETNTCVYSTEVLENTTHMYGLTNIQIHNYSLKCSGTYTHESGTCMYCIMLHLNGTISGKCSNVYHSHIQTVATYLHVVHACTCKQHVCTQNHICMLYDTCM